MTNLEKIKNSSDDELIDFLLEVADYNDGPWDKWFNTTYCSRCPVEKVIFDHGPLAGQEQEACYCELHKNCRCFPEIDVFDLKEILKLWLKEAADE